MTKKRINIKLLSFILFLFGCILTGLWLGLKPNMLNAYYVENNTIYSSALSVNPDDYYHDNLMPMLAATAPDGINIYECGMGCWSFAGTASHSGAIEFLPHIELKPNTTYTGVVFDQDATFNGSLYFWDYDYNVSYMGVNLGTLNSSHTFTTPATLGRARLSIYLNVGTSINTEFRFMLVEGTEVPTEYHSAFAFGFLAYNTSSSNIRSVYLDNYNNNTYTLYNNDSVYLPFQYSNNIVNFNYRIQNINSTGSDVNDVDIYYFPVFTGTLISDLSGYLKSDYIYTYNYLYYSNVNLTASNYCLTNVIELHYSTTFYDDDLLAPSSNCSYENVNIISNYTLPITQSNIINRTVYFHVEESAYILLFKVDFLYNNNVVYIFSFDNIGLGIKNSQVSGAFPVSTSTYDVYKTCGNFFSDFKCYVGNAVTYVIYNVPILGPIFSFGRSLVTLASASVNFLNEFSGFGVIFSCTTIPLFILIFKKLYGGD